MSPSLKRRRTRIVSASVVSLLVLVSTGCAIERIELELPARLSTPLTPTQQARFDYAWVGSVSLTPVMSDDTVEVSDGVLTVMFPQAPDEAQAAVLFVKFQYWRSKVAEARAPAVLITPILGGGKRLAQTHCGDFARNGMHVILAWRGMKVLRKSWRIDRIERFLRRAIGARRALIDWAEARREIDPARIGAFGVSMGGIVTTALLGTEPRLKAGVVALAGGDVSSIVRRSVEGRLVRFREAKMAELGIDADAVEALMRSHFPSDPLTLAAAVDPRRVLFVSTRFDEVVPPPNQEALWTALGKPLRYDIPAGHYSAIVYLPFVTRLVVKFLSRKLRVAKTS